MAVIPLPDKATIDAIKTAVDSLVSLTQAAAPTTVTMYSITCAVANQEYPQALPANTKKILFRERDLPTYTQAGYRMAYATGKVGPMSGSFQTFGPGGGKVVDDINLASGTLYFASSTAGTIIELEVWS